MKLTLLSLILLLGFIGFSQNPQLTQNTWYFNQIETPNVIITQPISFRNVGVALNMEINGDFDTYAHNDCFGQVSYDINNIEFVLNSASATLSIPNDPAVANFDQEYTQFFLQHQSQTFTYSINNSGMVESLRITNPAGKIAVYQNVPLSETSFQLSSTDIFMSPSANQILIDAKEIPLSLLSFELFDLSGKRVLSAQKIENDQIDISSLKSGFYIFKLMSSDGNFKTFKFSK